MNKYRTKSDLKIFTGFYKPHLGLFILDMCCALLIAVIDVAFPMATRFAINNLLPQNLFGAFFGLTLGLAAAYIIRSGLQYIVTYWGHLLGVLMEADMRRDIFSHLQRLSFKFYDSKRTGHIISHVTSDLFEITELAHHGPEDIFISLITLVGACVMLSSINIKVTLLIIILVPITLLFTISQRRRMSGVSGAVKERTAEINADIESSVSGVRVAKAFTNEDYEIEKFNIGNERFRHSKSKFYSAMAVFHSGMDFFINLFSIIVIIVGGYLIMKDEMNLTDLLIFVMYVSAFLQPVRKLTQFVEQYATGMAGFRRFLEIMRLEPEISDSPGAAELVNPRGEIRFEGVSFSYNDEAVVLNGIDLHIPAGRTLAVVGPSGGGKTTLCHLIPRFYDINSGSIKFDGTDLRNYTVKSLRRSIGIVSQDVFMFAGTIRENIGYGRIGATDDEILEAAQMAEILDLISELPAGLDTQVGERGIRLSGGQKQRLSIARIFLKNPPVLILDEATSALDTVTERRIQAAFDRLAEGRTTLVIAHRLSTIINADEIIYIDDEGIKEQGTHKELLAKGGLYASLYKMQFS